MKKKRKQKEERRADEEYILEGLARALLQTFLRAPYEGGVVAVKGFCGGVWLGISDAG